MTDLLDDGDEPILSLDEGSYEAARDHLEPDVSCRCGGCGANWRYGELHAIGDCCLTPGDPSPAGRCPDPDCDSLAYVVNSDPDSLTAEQVLYRTRDPQHQLDGLPLPALTTLLYRVCDNDPDRFATACRLVTLFIEEALARAANGQR